VDRQVGDADGHEAGPLRLAGRRRSKKKPGFDATSSMRIALGTGRTPAEGLGSKPEDVADSGGSSAVAGTETAVVA